MLNNYRTAQIAKAAFLISFISLVLTLYIGLRDANGEEIVEPDLTQLKGWEPTRDRNVIMSFGDGKIYKHHIKAEPAPLVSCFGARKVGSEVWLVTQDFHPVLYIIDAQPNAWKPENQDEWNGLIGRTSGFIKK